MHLKGEIEYLVDLNTEGDVLILADAPIQKNILFEVEVIGLHCVMALELYHSEMEIRSSVPFAGCQQRRPLWAKRATSS